MALFVILAIVAKYFILNIDKGYEYGLTRSKYFQKTSRSQQLHFSKTQAKQKNVETNKINFEL